MGYRFRQHYVLHVLREPPTAALLCLPAHALPPPASLKTQSHTNGTYSALLLYSAAGRGYAEFLQWRCLQVGHRLGHRFRIHFLRKLWPEPVFALTDADNATISQAALCPSMKDRSPADAAQNTVFNGIISDWDTSSVIDMYCMFCVSLLQQLFSACPRMRCHRLRV